MGLDQYVYKFSQQDMERNKYEQPDVFQYLFPDIIDVYLPVHYSEELSYWRKFYDLETWMEKLYRRKGGTAEDFNGILVKLTAADLLQLREDCTKDEFYKHHYFTDSPKDEKQFFLQKHKFVEFIQGMLQAIDDGYALYYESSW